MHNLFLLVKHDLRQGVLHRWKFFLISLLYFVFIDIVFIVGINTMFADTNVKCSISDIMLNIFIGNKPFDPTEGKGINIAINWIVFHTLLFSSIGFYLIDDLKKSATQIILRTKSRALWWTSKIIWCMVLVVSYYLLFFICAVLCGFFSGNMTFSLSDEIVSELYEITVQGVSMGKTIFTIIVLPMIVSISFAIVNAFISLIVKPIISLILVVCYLVASAFYESPILLFNYSMVLRNNFDGVNGVSNQNGVLISIVLLLICFTIGIKVIKKKDIL